MLRGRAAAGLATLALAAGCGGGDGEEPAPEAPTSITVTSPVVRDGGTVPERFTCDGADARPPLAWSGEPDRTRGFAVVMQDPDAPDGTFVHWTVYGIAPGVHRLPSAGAVEGENSFGDDGYGGPCPPEGDDPHRYVFYAYALRAPLGLDAGASPDEVRSAIADAALARGRLVATYAR